jgi:prolyl-tRNA synthetase
MKLDQKYADNTLLHKKDLVCGANKKDYHLIHVDMDRDVKVDSYLDLVNIEETDPCPRCGGKLKFLKGIEVGHVFKLGTKYSKAMNATFIDEDGKEKYMVMGCYGIGVSRIIAAAIEQNHDENGIIFPPSIAPFEIIILTLDLKDSKVLETSESLYKFLLNKNIDVIWDNRDLRAGFKFKDADLIGFPIQIIVGKKGVAQGIVEIKNRKTNEKLNISISEFKEKFEQIRQNIWKEWGIL